MGPASRGTYDHKTITPPKHLRGVCASGTPIHTLLGPYNQNQSALKIQNHKPQKGGHQIKINSMWSRDESLSQYYHQKMNWSQISFKLTIASK